MAHLDFTPDNLVLDGDFHLKMIDFGSSQKFQNTLTDSNQSFAFTAPDELEQNFETDNTESKFSAAKVDIFCLGIVLFFFQYRRAPFKINAGKIKLKKC